MQLRDAAPEDAEAITAVSARASREAYEPLVDDESIIELVEDPEFEAGVRKWLADVHDDAGVVILVATAEAGDDPADAVDSTGDTIGDSTPGVVGFAQCLVAPEYRPAELAGDDAYLKSLYVDPDWQGRGVGTELLEATVDRVEAAAVVLDVLRANDDAREFYEDRAFEYAGDTTVELGGATYETARYRREC